VPAPLSQQIFDINAGLFKAFQKIIQWIMYVLPIGLLCLLAGQMADVGPSVLIGMTGFIGVFYLGVFGLVFINSLILWRLSKESYLRSLSHLKETMLVAFGSKNPYIAMPLAIKSLKEDFHLEDHSVNLMVPLNFTLFSFGFVFTFGFATVFFTQLYDVAINPLTGFILLIACVFATIAAAGAPTIVAYSLLALTFDPFSMPYKPAVIIMLAIQALLAPGGVLLTVQTNCALTALIAKKARKKIKEPERRPA
jgi:proton glutamate symport protein